MISCVKDSLKNNDIIGLIIPDMEYDEKLIEAVSGMCDGSYNKILYLSVNKPYEKLMNKFNSNHADICRLLVIDCITRTAKNVCSTENCVYVSSPKALDEIQRTVLDILKDDHKIDLVLIDSPSSLLMYYEAIDVLKFMHLLTTKIMVAGCKGIIPFPKESCGPLRRSIEMFIDDTVYLSGGNSCSKSKVFLNPGAKLSEIISALRGVSSNISISITGVSSNCKT